MGSCGSGKYLLAPYYLGPLEYLLLNLHLTQAIFLVLV